VKPDEFHGDARLLRDDVARWCRKVLPNRYAAHAIGGGHVVVMFKGDEDAVPFKLRSM
jgi:hypothetical protein